MNDPIYESSSDAQSDDSFTSDGTTEICLEELQLGPQQQEQQPDFTMYETKFNQIKDAGSIICQTTQGVPGLGAVKSSTKPR